MNPEKSKIRADQVRNQNRYLRGLSVILSLAVLGLVGLLFFVISRDTTKIVPAVVTRPYSISGYEANAEYLSDMGDFIIAKVFSVNPITVDYNNTSILKLTDPDQYPQLKTTLDIAADRVKKDQISTVWSSTRVEAMPDQNRVFVKGMLATYIADKQVSNASKEYSVDFVFKSTGRLYISAIKEVVRNDQGAIIETK